MNCKWVYLVLCVLGAGLPYSQFIPWVMENGLHVKCFVQQLFANRVGGFFGLDVPVSAVVLFRFVSLEGKRLQMGRLWLPVTARPLRWAYRWACRSPLSVRR